MIQNIWKEKGETAVNHKTERERERVKEELNER